MLPPKVTALSAAILSCLSMHSVAAIPTVSSADAVGETQVYIRDADFAYHPSESMTQVIKARNAELPMHKRSTARVEACYAPDCTSCRVVFDGSFESNTPCIPAINTACLIVSNLNDAKVVFWNRAACNGNRNTHKGCGSRVNVATPGTNSIGVHVGCN
ncbi:hypothetical protein ACJZ2D_001825 [Fusarium nematophilum]